MFMRFYDICKKEKNKYYTVKVFYDFYNRFLNSFLCFVVAGVFEFPQVGHKICIFENVHIYIYSIYIYLYILPSSICGAR